MNTQSYQLGYSDAVRYGIARNLRDFPNGTLQSEYNQGYKAGERKVRKQPAQHLKG